MEKLEFALQVMVIGFSVVLFTLFVLYGILLSFSRIFSRPVKNHVKKTKLSAEPATSGGSEAGEGRKRAAIVAAVYQVMQEQGVLYAARQITISVQPAGNSSWHLIGKKALLENRMKLESIRRKKDRENI